MHNVHDGCGNGRCVNRLDIGHFIQWGVTDMEENKISDDSELELDANSVWERRDITTSSLADLNEIPVFSDSFEESIHKWEMNEKLTQQSIVKQMFPQVETKLPEQDIRMYLFTEQETELIIHNQSNLYEVKPIYQVVTVVGIMIAFTVCTMWMYRKKGTNRNHVDNHDQKFIRK